MRIGVVSDTHNNLANVSKIVSLFNNAKVDRVVHTGDITQAKTLYAFADLDCPLFGVYGNNDLERQSLAAAVLEMGFHFVDPPLRLDWHGRRLLIVHDPLDIDRYRADEQVVLHGHTHRQSIIQGSGYLTFNPGECAGFMNGCNAVGLVDLDCLEPEILNF